MLFEYSSCEASHARVLLQETSVATLIRLIWVYLTIQKNLRFICTFLPHYLCILESLKQVDTSVPKGTSSIAGSLDKQINTSLWLWTL